jgi:hypothetical protein
VRGRANAKHPEDPTTQTRDLLYTLARGWYVKSADSTWTVNWRHGSSTALPINLGFGRVWKLSGPELNAWVSGEMDGLPPIHQYQTNVYGEVWPDSAVSKDAVANDRIANKLS